MENRALLAVFAASITPDVTGSPPVTSISPVAFDIHFDQAIAPASLTASDLTATFTATAGSAAAAVTSVAPATGSTTNKDFVANVAMTGTADGTLTLAIAAGAVNPATGTDTSGAATSTPTVTFDNLPLFVSVVLSPDEPSTINVQPVHFLAVFNSKVTDFTASDVTLGGTAATGATAAVTALDGTQGRLYDIAVSNLTTSGTITASIPANKAHGSAGDGNQVSTGKSTATFSTTAPTALAVAINQATGQADAATALPLQFTAVFSEPVTGFDATKVSFTGSDASAVATVAGVIPLGVSGTTYEVLVGATGSGKVVVSVPANGVSVAGLPSVKNAASTSTDNQVTFTAAAASPLTVAVAPGPTQTLATVGSTIHYTATFSAKVTDFTSSDVAIGGTTRASTAVVTSADSGAGLVYDVAVSGMSTTGGVFVTVPAGAAHDASANPNKGSTSLGLDTNVVQFVASPLHVDEPGLFVPGGTWFLKNSFDLAKSDVTKITIPLPTNFAPIEGDWDGTGTTRIGVYDPATATFYLALKSDSSVTTTDVIKLSFNGLGIPASWIPIAGDWNADGATTIGLYDPVGATFYLANKNSTTLTGTGDLVIVSFAGLGIPTYFTPVVGDWNGDGATTIGLYDPFGATFYLANKNSTTLTGTGDLVVLNFKLAGVPNYFRPLAGDWNGDGITTIGLYDPLAATWYRKNALDTSASDVISTVLGPVPSTFLPIVGHWTPAAAGAASTASSSAGVAAVDAALLSELDLMTRPKSANSSALADAALVDPALVA